MEVHSHTHTERKKFTHYLWEFLMLFLAVFCGFLAEYQLEYKIESDREKQYAISMYEDLKMDTAQLGKVLGARKRRNEMFDSLFHMIDMPDQHRAFLYFFSRHITRTAVTTFVSNERTIQQLKNSGGLRLIRNRYVSDGIINYDSRVRFIQSWAPYIKPVMRTTDPEVVKDFAFMLEMDKENTILFTNMLRKYKKDAEELLKLLEQEYHLSERSERTPSETPLEK